MAIFELQGPDGAVYEVDAPDEAAAVVAFQGFAAPQAAPASAPAPVKSRSSQLMDAAVAAPDEASYRRLMAEANAAAVADGETPQGVVMNPATGQLTDLQSPINPLIREGGLRSAAQGAGQGLSMGGMDEVVSGLYGLVGPGTIGQNYAFADAVMDEELRRARENNPYITGAAEIAGGIGTGIAATSGIAPAAALPGRLGQAIGVGGASGAVYGGLSSEGDIADRAMGAGIGGLVGAGVGALSVPVAAGIGKGAGIVTGLYRNMRGGVNAGSVDDAINRAIIQSGRAPQEVMDDIALAVSDGSNSYALADALGTAGQRQLAGASRLGGPARTIVNEALEARQAGQAERVGAAFADALDLDSTAAARAAAMTAARGEAADAAYTAARAGASPVDVRGALGAIDDRIGPMQGSGVTGDSIDAKLASYRSRLASQGGPAMPGAQSVELSDFDRVLGVKQAIQDDIGAAVRAGRNNEARELGKVVEKLDEALEGASPDYRAANDGFRRATREIEQIDAGKAAAAPSRRAADTVAEYEKLTPAEKAAYRAGYGDKLMSTIEGGAEGVNKARPFTSEKSVAELAAMSRDPNRLARALDRENVMFETRRIATGGSQTADNLAEISNVGGILQGLSRAIGSPLQTASGVLNAVSRASSGQNEATRTALVQALMSNGDDASATIARAIARGEKLTNDQALALNTILYLQGGGVVQVAR